MSNDVDGAGQAEAFVGPCQPITTVGALIGVLAAYPADMPISVDGSDAVGVLYFGSHKDSSGAYPDLPARIGLQAEYLDEV